jgi:flagellar biosynthesis repressor protein FlbT
MPLTLRLKPGERLIVNGAVIRNQGTRALELEVLNHATMLHERDLMVPEQADTPLKSLYFHVQMMHLEPEQHERHYRPFIEVAARLFAERLEGPDPEGLAPDISQVIGLVGQNSFPAALRKLQRHIGKPGDVRQGQKRPATAR